MSGVLRAAARRLDGMFAGSMPPEEYEPLIRAGVLRFSYEGGAGFMGLAKLRLVENPHGG